MLHYDHAWPGNRETCPCDWDFADYLDEHRVDGATIFHFGTGTHHTVGKRAQFGNNAVLGITASKGEAESYVELAIADPRLSATYKVLFGDIYVLDPRHLPRFDFVTLFHLCEETDDRRDEYGGGSDIDVASMLVEKLNPGGVVAFYTRSAGWGRAEPVVAELLYLHPLDALGDYRSLRLYQMPP